MSADDRDLPALGEAGRTTGTRGTPAPVRLTPGSLRVFGLFLAGPLIWTGHFLLVYLVAEAGCTGNGPGLRALDPPVPALTTYIGTAVAAIACLIAAGAAWWTARGAEHQRMLLLAGAVLSLLGAVTVIMVGMPAWFLTDCGP